MEIARGIHIIPGTIGQRPLQLALLRGELRCVLLDSGTAQDPERIIIPFLAELGIQPAELELVINTHADADHVGGNANLKRAFPHVYITCGEADRALIQEPAAMITQRYNAYKTKHAIAPDDAVHQWYVEMLGDAEQVDWTWRGSETLRLSRDWVIEIHATPGHSAGHLTIFDPRSQTALMGDAVHGGIGRDAAGNFTYPAYIDVPQYLDTLKHLRALEIETLVGCHWDIMRGAEVGAFLDASQAYVERLDELLLAELKQRPQGATLRELLYAIGARLSEGRAVSELELVFTCAANMDHLAATARVVAEESQHPVRYHLATR